MTPSLHIASFAVRCDPALLEALLADLRRLPGIEIGAQDAASGKIVLVMEAPDDDTIARTLTEIQLMAPVASAAMVYHHHLNETESDPTGGNLA